MSEKICPFRYSTEGRELHNFPCIKEQCMAWGVIKYSFSDKEKHEYGCKLIEK